VEGQPPPSIRSKLSEARGGPQEAPVEELGAPVEELLLLVEVCDDLIDLVHALPFCQLDSRPCSNISL
jgi:hypothetical protein